MYEPTEHLRYIDIKLVRNNTTKCSDKQGQDVEIFIEESIGSDEEND